MKKDSPLLHSTVPSRGLEQEPLGRGAFRKGHVCAPYPYGDRQLASLCALRGEGAMFVAAVGGGGSDSGILQEFERTRDSCLAGRTRKDNRTHWVFISPCLSSSLPQTGQWRRPGERRYGSAPGPGRIIHSCNESTHLYHTLTC